jgi:hypothetical protein
MCGARNHPAATRQVPQLISCSHSSLQEATAPEDYMYENICVGRWVRAGLLQ